MDITRRKFLGTASVGVASVGIASAGPASAGPASAGPASARIIMGASNMADPPLINMFPGGLSYIDEDFLHEYEKSVYANFGKIT